MSKETAVSVFRVGEGDESSVSFRNIGRYYVRGSLCTLEEMFQDFEVGNFGFVYRSKQDLNQLDDTV